MKVDITNQNTLSNKVIVHFDMLCSRVERFRARYILLMLSQKRVVGSLMGTPRSFSILLSHTTSHVATTAPLYSTSVLERATVGYFLLLQDMAMLLREKTNPEVDLLSAL